ncbi:phosphoribosyl-ATP pyrophosphohydrolase [Jeotgalibacillus sp. S-D1]|uniref:nucleoside triphosphate pyrophosphohydrolase n=1 Tax=Jeotgalibacillus sp. S-D1 TaxID=2552189 RepID=UPI00105A48C7|nr:nucleoside triphosphate pyrophosphohydrolase [Jeotgalibacillus sp. S-D1]TDL31264.1 phosphoribosyl-ATP pyrophosphohydrolase [Jeotgalibacillus sp. S-D1]
MPVYNKLVRDRIPEIIEQSGSKSIVKILDTPEYLVELKNKMHEELEEYKKAQTDEEAIEELADILELVYAAARNHGAAPEELQNVREDKRLKRGGFEKRLFLIEAED